MAMPVTTLSKATIDNVDARTGTAAQGQESLAPASTEKPLPKMASRTLRMSMPSNRFSFPEFANEPSRVEQWVAPDLIAAGTNPAKPATDIVAPLLASSALGAATALIAPGPTMPALASRGRPDNSLASVSSAPSLNVLPLPSSSASTPLLQTLPRDKAPVVTSPRSGASAKTKVPRTKRRSMDFSLLFPAEQKAVAKTEPDSSGAEKILTPRGGKGNTASAHERLLGQLKKNKDKIATVTGNVAIDLIELILRRDSIYSNAFWVELGATMRQLPDVALKLTCAMDGGDMPKLPKRVTGFLHQVVGAARLIHAETMARETIASTTAATDTAASTATSTSTSTSTSTASSAATTAKSPRSE